MVSRRWQVCVQIELFRFMSWYWEWARGWVLLLDGLVSVDPIGTEYGFLSFLVGKIDLQNHGSKLIALLCDIAHILWASLRAP